MNDNDVMVWQARILAGQADMIDRMGKELGALREAVDNPAPCDGCEKAASVHAADMAVIEDLRAQVKTQTLRAQVSDNAETGLRLQIVDLKEQVTQDPASTDHARELKKRDDLIAELRASVQRLQWTREHATAPTDNTRAQAIVNFICGGNHALAEVAAYAFLVMREGDEVRGKNLHAAYRRMFSRSGIDGALASLRKGTANGVTWRKDAEGFAYKWQRNKTYMAGKGLAAD